MATGIVIRAGGQDWPAELNETFTAGNALKLLPLSGSVSRWGAEIYFTTAVDADPRDPTRVKLDPGDIAYSAAHRAFCLFWGRTPASDDDAPAAAGPVVVIGRLTAGFDGLDAVVEGASIEVGREPAELTP